MRADMPKISGTVRDLLAEKQHELDALATQYQTLLDAWEKFQNASQHLAQLLHTSTIPTHEIAKLFNTKMPVLRWITNNFAPTTTTPSTPQEENPQQ